MDKRLDNDDWEEAFQYANPATRILEFSGDNENIDREAVEEIAYIEEGENDGENWILCARLKDGRWFFLSAGCDYTGWDCQAGGEAKIARTKEDIIRFGMGQEDRDRFGIPELQDIGAGS